jgi:hypothetical protein
VLQPVIQFGTAIHGNGLSGSALNCFQKLVHVFKAPLRPQKSVKK